MKKNKEKKSKDKEFNVVLSKLRKLERRFKIILVLFILFFIIFSIVLWYLIKELNKNKSPAPPIETTSKPPSNSPIPEGTATPTPSDSPEDDAVITPPIVEKKTKLSTFLIVILSISVVFLLIFILLMLYILRQQRYLKSQGYKLVGVTGKFAESLKQRVELEEKLKEEGKKLQDLKVRKEDLQNNIKQKTEEINNEKKKPKTETNKDLVEQLQKEVKVLKERSKSNNSQVLIKEKVVIVTERELKKEEEKMRKNYNYLKAIAERYGELTEDPSDLALDEINSRIEDLVQSIQKEYENPSINTDKKVEDINMKIRAWGNVKSKNKDYIELLQKEREKFDEDYNEIMEKSFVAVKQDIEDKYSNKLGELRSRMGIPLLGVLQAKEKIPVESEGGKARFLSREEYIRKRPDLTQIPLSTSIREKLALYYILPNFSPFSEEKAYKWKESIRDSIKKSIPEPEFSTKPETVDAFLNDESNKSSYFWSIEFLEKQEKKKKEIRDRINAENKAIREKEKLERAKKTGKVQATGAFAAMFGARKPPGPSVEDSEPGKLKKSKINALANVLSKSRDTAASTSTELKNIAKLSSSEFQKRKKKIEQDFIRKKVREVDDVDELAERFEK
jgi:hypothetical protein